MRHDTGAVDRDRRAPSEFNGDWISDLPDDLDCLALRPVLGDSPGRIDELARDGLVRVPGPADDRYRHGRIC